MHAKDLIYMAYFDPHRVFDGLTSYIYVCGSILSGQPSYAIHWTRTALLHFTYVGCVAAVLAYAVGCCAPFSAWLSSGGGCAAVIPLVESQLLHHHIYANMYLCIHVCIV